MSLFAGGRVVRLSFEHAHPAGRGSAGAVRAPWRRHLPGKRVSVLGMQGLGFQCFRIFGFLSLAEARHELLGDDTYRVRVARDHGPRIKREGKRCL